MQRSALLLAGCLLVSMSSLAADRLLPEESRVPGGVALIPLTGLESARAPINNVRVNPLLFVDEHLFIDKQ
jgi:hypothetical protein